MQKLSAKTRSVAGKKVKQLRREDLVPAAVYGPTRESINIAVDKKSFIATLKEAGHSRLVQMELEGESKPFRVLIKEVQKNVLTGDPVHVSFYQVDPSQKLTAEVPINIEGMSPAVKNNLGFLATPISEVVVRCLPDDLPPFITIDVSGLAEVGDSITIADLNLGEGVEIDSSMQVTEAVAYIAVPQKKLDIEETPTAEGEEGAAAEGEATEEPKEAAE